MSLKFRNEIDFATFDNLTEENGNVVYELSCLAFNIKKSCSSFGLFSFLLKKMKKNVQKMFF
jgi:hypothetical protein